nr:hypothetical protein GCM10025732_46620 [Glycomyces mayteni]
MLPQLQPSDDPDGKGGAHGVGEQARVPAADAEVGGDLDGADDEAEADQLDRGREDEGAGG